MSAIVMVLLALGNADSWEQAKRSFEAGLEQRERGRRGSAEFLHCALAIETLRREGASSPELFHTLGNAYFLAGDLPRAIFAYREGMNRYPASRTLRDCLAFAREQVHGSGAAGEFSFAETPWWMQSRSKLVGATVLYLAGWGLLTYAGMRRRRDVFALGGLLVLASLGVVGGTRSRPSVPFVVVAREGVTLRRGNGEAFPPRLPSPLPRGEEAILLALRDDWCQVRLRTGEMGWLPIAEVVRD